MSQKKRNGASAKKVIEWFVKAVIFIGSLLPIGPIFGTRHARDFSDARKVEDGPDSAPVEAVEFKDPDEDRLFRDIMLCFAEDCLAHTCGAGQHEHFEDKHWGAGTGLVEGQLVISDTSQLPFACRVGLFETAGSYPVVSRPNFLHDGGDIRVSRLSLKLSTPFDVPNVYAFGGQARELDLLLSEGVRQQEAGDQDGQGFFFRDARQLRYLSGFPKRPARSIMSLLNSANAAVFSARQKIMHDAVDTLYLPKHAHKNWAEKDYYSAGPYRLGGVLVKFALRSRHSNIATVRAPGGHGPARDQALWFAAWERAGKPAVFDLCLQVARYGAIRAPSKRLGEPCKAVMATEFTDLVWDEGVSPFHKVGTLTLRSCAAQAQGRPWYFEERDRWYPRDMTPAYALRFNAWNTLPSMVPVGQLFRARKQVHAMHRETRLRHSMNAAKDLEAACPFAQRAAQLRDAS
ncbi:MAG: hypothetical protein AAF943_16330 [Pseudomonadota bacterium]